MHEKRLRSIARRALARAKAGLTNPSSSGTAPRVSGCLLSVADLEGLGQGTRLRVAPGTKVTPLARDEAWSRGITLVEEHK